MQATHKGDGVQADAILTFSGNALDREAVRRRDHHWLEARLADESSRFLPVWRLQPLVKTGAARALAWARREFYSDLSPAPEPVLLGSHEGVTHFAVDVSAVEQPEQTFGRPRLWTRAGALQLCPPREPRAGHHELP